ncbi:MAG: hypothetical protein IKQ22_03595 [Clostridia bacterium]|nr:hypothetical protein [Clostridia bacterium]
MNEDLIKEVKALAGEVRANEDKEDQLRKQLAQVCVDNYNQYVYPMLLQQTAVLNAIQDTLGHYLNLESYHKFVLVAAEKYEIIIRCPYTNNNKLAFRIEPASVSTSIVSCMNKADTSSGGWYGNAAIVSYFFGNEDAVQMTCGFINDLFVEQLNTIKKNCTDKNEKLKQIIDELTLRLSVAHVPVHKEDGTVEVMIGGKKFVGKLEEDTNGADDN